MAVPPRPRDSRLIDALEAFTHESFEAAVWRVVREGRDPTQCSAAGGRWDDRTFDVLYTSLDRDGAIAEMHFHLMRGQPVFPSRVGYGLYALKARLKAMLRLPTLDALGKLGLDAARYGQLTYNERNAEYPRPQEIAEVAHFLDCDGILVPSARWPCANLVLFCDRLPPDAIEVGHDHGLVDWRRWERANPRR